MEISFGTSDSGSHFQENVTKKLYRKIELRNDLQRSFLPKEAMENVLTENTIQLLLSQIPNAGGISLGDITGDRKRVKLLSILLLAERLDVLKHLIDHRVSDVDLPLELDHSRLTPCLGRERGVMAAFLTSQFKVCVPVLDFSQNTIKVEQLHKDQKLPFLTKTEPGKGGQGRVWRVEIPPGHFTIRTRSNTWGQFREGPGFALKEFSDRDDFDRELDALNHFKAHNKHEHLINLLSAYSQGNKYFMIFPLAEGNLDRFWHSVGSRHRHPLWLLEQCYGLTEGLCKVHQYQQDEPGKPSADGELCVGRHGDIKPQNILWFKESSTTAVVDRLVLSDFTLMRFHNEGSNTVTTVGHIGFTNTYRAPEVAFTSHQYINQKYDVWSIGCVFLEFISWYLVGYNATRGEQFRGDDGQDYQSFRTARFMEDSGDFKYYFRDDNYFRFERTTGEAHVKTSVSQWISYLHGMERCSDALHHFLELVQNHMLVPEPEIRWSIDEVLHELEKIRSRSRAETKYCSASTPLKVGADHQFPALWTKGDNRQSRRRHLNIPTSTQDGWTSSTHSAAPTHYTIPYDAGPRDDIGGSLMPGGFSQTTMLF